MPGGFTMNLRVQDSASSGLLQLALRAGRPDVRKVMGRAVGKTLRTHFTKLDRERKNKLGGQRTHFYADVRRSVQQPELIGGDGVKVSINHVGIAQRYFGGDIEAKPGRKLTIPVHPAAHGKRAREFTDLHAIYFDSGDGILVKDNTESSGDIGEVYYRLLTRVHQDEDPTVLPTDDALQTAAVVAGEEFLLTLKQRARES